MLLSLPSLSLRLATCKNLLKLYQTTLTHGNSIDMLFVMYSVFILNWWLLKLQNLFCEEHIPKCLIEICFDKWKNTLTWRHFFVQRPRDVNYKVDVYFGLVSDCVFQWTEVCTYLSSNVCVSVVLPTPYTLISCLHYTCKQRWEEQAIWYGRPLLKWSHYSPNKPLWILCHGESMNWQTNELRCLGCCLPVDIIEWHNPLMTS